MKILDTGSLRRFRIRVTKVPAPSLLLLNDNVRIRVIDELKYDMGARGTEIGVAVKDGVVTLSANVNSFPG